MKIRFLSAFLLLAHPLHAVTTRVEVAIETTDDLYAESSNSLGASFAGSSNPAPGSYGLGREAFAAMPALGTHRAYASLINYGTSSANVYTRATSASTSRYLATHASGPGTSFAATLPMSLDGTFSGILTNPSNISLFSNLSVELRFRAIVHTPNSQSGPDGFSAVTYMTTTTFLYNETLGAFQLSSVPNSSASYLSTPAIETPGGGFIPTDSIFALTNSSTTVPDGYLLDLQGNIPFIAVAGEEYFLETSLEIIARNDTLTLGTGVGMGTPSNDFTYGISADFRNTATTTLTGSGSGSFQFLAVPEPSTALLLLTSLMTLTLRRRP